MNCQKDLCWQSTFEYLDQVCFLIKVPRKAVFILWNLLHNLLLSLDILKWRCKILILSLYLLLFSSYFHLKWWAERRNTGRIIADVYTQRNFNQLSVPETAFQHRPTGTVGSFPCTARPLDLATSLNPFCSFHSRHWANREQAHSRHSFSPSWAPTGQRASMWAPMLETEVGEATGSSLAQGSVCAK